jgi:hypothetical protein
MSGNESSERGGKAVDFGWLMVYNEKAAEFCRGLMLLLPAGGYLKEINVFIGGI